MRRLICLARVWHTSASRHLPTFTEVVGTSPVGAPNVLSANGDLREDRVSFGTSSRLKPLLSKMKCLVALRACLAVVLVAGCLDAGPPVLASPQVENLAGAWVFHVGGGQFADHVQVVLVSVTEDPEWPLRITPVHAKDWRGTTNRDLACVVCLGRTRPFGGEWNLRLTNGDSAV